ncbi:MAG: hypothetical protein PHZ14_04650 [Sulfuricella sp.]|nr:hypothetical protein [Sulfuricella sp.]
MHTDIAPVSQTEAATQRSAVAAELANMQQGQRTDLIPSANLQNVSQTLKRYGRCYQVANLHLDFSIHHVPPILKRYGVEQHAHVIVLGAPMHSRALDIFRLFLLCR